MILSKVDEFADSVVLTATWTAPTTAALLGNVMDLGAAPTLKNIGSGEPMYFVFQVDESVAGTSGTQIYLLASDSTADLATSKTTHITTPTFTTAQLVAGFMWVSPLPLTETYERYLGVWMTSGTATITAGKVSAFLTNHPQMQYAAFLPDGIP